MTKETVVTLACALNALLAFAAEASSLTTPNAE
jgi:hypothetical protein